MKYILLLWPHANVRYQNETMKLAESELRLMLDVFAPEGEIAPCNALEMPALEIALEHEMDGALLAALRGHSLMYGLFRMQPDGAMLPVCGRANAYVGVDLPGILKYKGKTNELFLQLMENVALYAGDFARRGAEPLELMDPMCGRGTALFVGANRGWNTTGSDLDKGDLAEAEKFLKRYFEFHHMKYNLNAQSRTMPGGKGVPVKQFRFADTPENYREGNVRSLSLANADAARVRDVFGREKFHMIVCDLPYGVQHAPLGGSWEKLLRTSLVSWRDALKKGGAIALSFNQNTLKRHKVLEWMQEAGLEVKSGGAYEAFDHWVEQAVTRDIAVGRKKK